MSLTSQNIETLIALCRRKDQKAQFEIYNRYSKAMYNVACRIVKDTHFAEDIMQEGFLKAFTKIDDYRQQVPFGAWLKKIIVNHSVDFYKKNGRIQYNDFEKAVYKLESEPETETDFTHLKRDQVLNAVNSLQENYRMIINLFFIEGYDQEEIAEILNISHTNCRTMLSRAKESLRKKLNQI